MTPAWILADLQRGRRGQIRSRRIAPITIRAGSPFHRLAFSCAHRTAKTAIVEAGRKRMFGREAVIEVERQITRFGKLHPELAMALGASRNPSAAMQIDRDRKGPAPLGTETSARKPGRNSTSS